MKQNNKQQLGFTLIEIMVALFIFTIIAMIAVTGLHTILKSRERINANANYFAKLQISMVLMGRDLEQLVNRPITDIDGHGQPPITGDSSKHYLEFTHAGLINPLAIKQRSTLQRVAYYLHKQKLMRKTWPHLDRAPGSKPDAKVLLDNVIDMQIRFLDSNKEWHKIWPLQDNNIKLEQNPLPLAVRVTIDLKHWGKIIRTWKITNNLEPL